ncbi:MAG: branched-chain amino acid ABC transporter permease [Nitrospirota bacterium]
MNTIIAGAVYTMIALGFNLIYRVTKFFNIAHGAFIVTGGYVVFFLHKALRLGLMTSVILSMLSVGALGMLVDKAVFSTLRKKQASSLTMLVASLGILWALQSLIALTFGTEFQRLSGKGEIAATFNVLGAMITDVQVITIIAGFSVMIGLVMMVNMTRFGKAIMAVGDDDEVAKIIGIDTERIIGYVFFIGSAAACLGGTLIGFDIGLIPTMGVLLLLKGVTASIIGGVGNIYGGVLGAYMLGLAENIGVLTLSSGWKDATAFGLLIIFLVFRPRGIMNN